MLTHQHFDQAYPCDRFIPAYQWVNKLKNKGVRENDKTKVWLGIILGGGYLGHIPLLFGIGGTLILLFFIGILRFWAKERMALEGTSTAAANLKLAGYVFMLIAAWFTCGIASQPFLKALEEASPSNPEHVIILLVLGWFFLFLGHSKSRQQ